MVDISDGGARLKVDPRTELPAEFILVISRDGRFNRRARAIWRQDDMVGIRFLSQKSLGPAPKQKKYGMPLPPDFWDETNTEGESVEAPDLDPANADEPASG
jgi:hypothetical protein